MTNLPILGGGGRHYEKDPPDPDYKPHPESIHLTPDQKKKVVDEAMRWLFIEEHPVRSFAYYEGKLEYDSPHRPPMHFITFDNPHADARFRVAMRRWVAANLDLYLERHSFQGQVAQWATLKRTPAELAYREATPLPKKILKRYASHIKEHHEMLIMDDWFYENDPRYFPQYSEIARQLEPVFKDRIEYSTGKLVDPIEVLYSDDVSKEIQARQQEAYDSSMEWGSKTRQAYERQRDEEAHKQRLAEWKERLVTKEAARLFLLKTAIHHITDARKVDRAAAQQEKWRLQAQRERERRKERKTARS